MKRTLCALIPGMVLVASAVGQVRSAEVLYTNQPETPISAFRLLDECFLPIESARIFGWEAISRGNEVEVRLNDKAYFAPFRNISGRQTLALRHLVSAMGGDSMWTPGQDRLEVFAPLQSIRVDGGAIRATARFPFLAKPFMLTNPSRVVVDLIGARLVTGTEVEVPEGARVSQFRSNTVRIVLETPFLPAIPRSAEPAPEFELNVVANQEVPAEALPAPTQPQGEPIQTPPTTEPEPVAQEGGQPATRSTLIDIPLNLQVNLAGERATLLALEATGVRGVSFRKPEPSQLEITVPGFRLIPPESFSPGTDWITGATVTPTPGGSVLLLQLSRPLGAEVWTDAAGVQIQLLRPDVGNGRLAGKVVVVDPGHGGRDGGATRAGVSEKNIVLSIGLLLSRALAEHGATVLMTRKTDVFVPLAQRAELANRNRADFFISLHANSSTRDERTRGTITFHHRGRADGRLLAECIHAEIVKVSGLPSIGVWSDGRIHDSGFAVLRGTRMPGVLIEFGFVNHSQDRARLVTQEFQRRMASAVVKGIKSYLGDE